MSVKENGEEKIREITSSTKKENAVRDKEVKDYFQILARSVQIMVLPFI